MTNRKKLIVSKSKSISIINKKIWRFSNIFFKKKHIINKK